MVLGLDDIAERLIYGRRPRGTPGAQRLRARHREERRDLHMVDIVRHGDHGMLDANSER